MPSPARQLLITAAEARARGFPAVALSVDLEDTVLAGFPVSQQGYLLMLSGPPGGPLGASVEIVAAGATLEELVRERFDRPNYGPLRIGGTSTVDVAGGQRPGLAFATGRSHAAMSHVATLVEFRGKDFAALVILGCGGHEPDAGATLGQRDLAAVAKTLRISA